MEAFQLRPLYLREVCLRLVNGDSEVMASDVAIPVKSVKVVLERLKEYQCDKCVFKSLTGRGLRHHVRAFHPVYKGISAYNTSGDQADVDKNFDGVLRKCPKIILRKCCVP